MVRRGDRGVTQLYLIILILSITALSVACPPALAIGAGADDPGAPAAERAGDAPWLGVAVTRGPDGGAGALVTSVVSGGPAAGAGINEGDVILSIDGETVDGPATFVQLMRGYFPEDTVVVELDTPAGKKKVSVVLGRAPGYIYSVDGDKGPGGAGYPRGMGAAPALDRNKGLDR